MKRYIQFIAPFFFINAATQEEILKQFNKKNMNIYIRAYIERLDFKSKKGFNN